jgi:hypothetical protein
MPVYEVQTDAGKFQIEAADEQALAAAVNELPQASGASLSGVAKSAGAGLVEGLAGLAGLPADALDLLARGSDALLGTKAAQESGPIAAKIGSQAMLDRVKGITGPMYESQGGIEEGFRTAGSFLPAMLGGAASIPVKAATRVALPAVAAEGAKALTAGTAAEPYAGIAGALGGLAGGMGIERAITRPAVAARPTRADVAKRTDDLYADPQLKNVQIAPNPVGQFVDDLKVKIDRDVAADFDAERTFKMLDKLKGNAPVGVRDVDRVRKRLGEYAGELNANFKPTPNARAAMAARQEIDDFLANLQQPQLLAGDAQAASGVLREARSTAQQGMKMDKIARWLRDAEIDAAKSHSGGNLENVIYQKIATALKNREKHLRGWSKEEVSALQRVLPNMAESILRRGGKLLGGGGGLGQLASGAAGGSMLGFPGMVGLPALGMAMNKAGSAIASRKLNNVTDILAANTPMYAANRPAFQQSLQGGGLLGNLPSPAQGSLYAALMAQRPQPVQ